MIDEAHRKAQAELNRALAKAQGEFPAITRNKKVEVETKTGGRYSYRYADLASIIAEVRPILAANGLALVQVLVDEAGGPGLRTELRHAGGGMISGTFPLRVPDDPQALGSMLTYLRRYAITATLGIAADDDDDGAAARPRPGKGRPKKTPVKTAEAPTFEAPAPRGDPELAPLVTEVQNRFELLRKLEADLEQEPRDWSDWTRARLGLAAGELGTADHYRQALEILGKEESSLVGELARKTAKSG